MNAYSAWGFSEVPFQVTALPATEQGSRLLVGREAELSQLTRRLAMGSKLATLEGPNGVGKTSLVNVAAFRAYQHYLTDDTGPLLIPCGRTFQLSGTSPTSEFAANVWYEVAQSLLRNAAALNSRGAGNSKMLDRWLNSPILGRLGASIGVSAAGNGATVGASKSESANTGDGFRSSGFQTLVAQWLAEIFPETGSGGVVCVIDNLEILKKSSKAREQLEVLRDELLSVRGLRWVLCGALGIVHGIAASPRLDGTLYDPIDLSGIADSLATEVLDTRVQAFGVIDDPYLPLETAHFSELYQIMHGNLRATLSHADEYCQHVADRGARPSGTAQKTLAFRAWLDLQTKKYAVAAEALIAPTAWGVFDKAVVAGGGFSPSSFADFGFESIAALRQHVRDLEDAGLLVGTQDDGDRRRKTIRVTPKGWFVNRARTQR